MARTTGASGVGAAVAEVGWVAGWGVAAFATGYAVGTGINYFAGDYIQAGLDYLFNKKTKSDADDKPVDKVIPEIMKDARKSLSDKHSKGFGRKKRDQGGEKGDARRSKWNSTKPWRGLMFPAFDDRRDRGECDESP